MENTEEETYQGFTEEQLNKFALLDKENLDYELEAVSKDSNNVGKALARAIKERDTALNELEEKKADVELDVRSDPSSYNLNQVNNNSVEASVVSHHEVKEAAVTLVEKNYIVNVLNRNCKAIDRKGASTEWLGRLYLSNYWVDKGTMGLRLRDAVIEREHQQTVREEYMDDEIKERLQRVQEDKED